MSAERLAIRHLPNAISEVTNFFNWGLCIGHERGAQAIGARKPRKPMITSGAKTAREGQGLFEVSKFFTCRSVGRGNKRDIVCFF